VLLGHMRHSLSVGKVVSKHNFYRSLVSGLCRMLFTMFQNEVVSWESGPTYVETTFQSFLGKYVSWECKSLMEVLMFESIKIKKTTSWGLKIPLRFYRGGTPLYSLKIYL
jgi:hypothetical protein